MAVRFLDQEEEKPKVRFLDESQSKKIHFLDEPKKPAIQFLDEEQPKSSPFGQLIESNLMFPLNLVNAARKQLMRKQTPQSPEKETLQRFMTEPVANMPLTGPIAYTKLGRRLISDFEVGGLGVVSGTLAAIPAAEATIGRDQSTIGKVAEKTAIEMDKLSAQLMPDDPNFGDKFMVGAGSMATFMLPAAGASTIVANVPRMGILAARLAPIIGTGISTVLESATEAGGVYKDQINKGFSREVAGKSAFHDFWVNTLVIGLTNRFGPFAEKGTHLAKALKSAPLEGIQEAAQEITSSLTKGEQINWRNVAEAAGIGGILGGGTGAIIPTQFTFTKENLGPKASQYLDQNLPELSRKMEGRTLPITEEAGKEAITKAMAKLEESLILGASERDSKIAAINEFTKAIQEAPRQTNLPPGGIPQETTTQMPRETVPETTAPTGGILEQPGIPGQEQGPGIPVEEPPSGGPPGIPGPPTGGIPPPQGPLPGRRPNEPKVFTERFALKRSLQRQASAAKQAARMTKQEIEQQIKDRRISLRQIKDVYGLSYSDLNKMTKSRKDIRHMNQAEYADYLYDIEAKASTFAQKREIKKQILNQIKEKELQKTDNLRLYFQFPSLENMTVDQLTQFNTALLDTQQGDEFLSVRKLETVKNTELKGVKTVREAKNVLAKKLGVALSEIENINVSPLDKFRFDTALADRNPFYRLLVDETNMSLLEGEQKYHQYEREVDDLTKKARKSRSRGLLDKSIPTDELVFQWLEAENKAPIAEQMTQEEMDLANYVQSRFSEFRDYLIQQGAMEKYQDNYITHIRRGFLEAWKQDGLIDAFKGAFNEYVQDAAVFKILEDDTQNILPMEKFFQFAMHRTGELKPSLNVSKAFKAYTQTFMKKRALDKIVPALDIYAYSLSPKETTPRGLMMNRRLIKFVREWVNNKKGRRSSLGGIIPQGGPVDIGLRAANAFVTFIDLGWNIPVGLSSVIGENVMSYINLGEKRYALGLQRSFTPKGKKILKDNIDFVGKSLWDELTDTANDIGDTFNKGMFSLFSISNRKSNSIHLLGSLTTEEWETGKISFQRKAEMLREMGRYRHVEGSKSIFGSTSVGGALTKYKTWALPPLRTNIKNIDTLIRNLGQGNFKQAIQDRGTHELLRSSLLTTLIVLAGSGMIDDDDNTFVGTLLKKAYRESLSVLGAIDPTVLSSVRLLSFLGDLSVSLKQIVMLEEYKRKGGYKGVSKLKQTITPRVVKQILPKE